MSDERPKRRARRPFLSRWRGPSEAAVRRRRRAFRGGVAALLVFFFVVAPTFIALQPNFFERFPGLEDYYATWTKSVHAEVTCQSCHTEPGLARQSLYAAKMLGEFYLEVLPISREPKVQDVPNNAMCQSCHIDLRSVSPSGDLRIPHNAHVGVLKITCVHCHDALVHETNINGNHAPTMEMCLKCHNGKKAKDECEACHTRKAIPDDHKAADWTVVHSQRKDTVDCAKCHGWTKTWCAECHSRRPKGHTTDWRAKHRDKVELRRNCEACHKGEFCIKCHGEVPQLNFDPALQLVVK